MMGGKINHTFKVVSFHGRILHLATTVAGTWGFLGKNSGELLILHFPTMSTDKNCCLVTSALDSRDTGLEFPHFGG